MHNQMSVKARKKMSIAKKKYWEDRKKDLAVMLQKKQAGRAPVVDDIKPVVEVVNPVNQMPDYFVLYDRTLKDLLKTQEMVDKYKLFIQTMRSMLDYLEN